MQKNKYVVRNNWFWNERLKNLTGNHEKDERKRQNLQKKKKENCPLKDSVWRGTFDLRRNYRCSWCGRSVYFFGFRLLILIELRKVSGEDKDGVWGVNRSFRITWAHNRCCVCVCVADNEIRAPPPPLRVSILFSPIRLHSSLPPFSSLPLLHLGFSCRASLHILLNKKKLSPDVFFFFLSSYDVVGRAVLFLNSGLNTITTLNFEFSDSLKSICSESMCSVLKAEVWFYAFGSEILLT